MCSTTRSPATSSSVDARGDMTADVFGQMMMTHFKGRGGAVIDGCVRDSPEAKKLDLGLWLRGVTPNFHANQHLSLRGQGPDRLQQPPGHARRHHRRR